MKQFLLLGLLMLLLSGEVLAQTETPTVSSEYVFATVEAGQMTRFDYVATAGSVHIANLLTLLFFSMWAMFFFGVFVVRRGQQS